MKVKKNRPCINGYNLSVLISLFALSISICTIVIVLCSVSFTEDINTANYIAIAATLLTGVVAAAVANNIYMNLAGTRKMTEDVVNTRMSDYISITDKKIQLAQERMAVNVAGSSDYSLGVIYYHLKEFDDALRYTTEAKIKFENCRHLDAIISCNDLISKIEKERQNT